MMKQGWHWMVLVGFLMAIVLVANLILIYFATSDPSFAVEEDYYQKALDWDERRAQQAANAALGWTVSFDVARARNPDGTVEVRTRLEDAAGMPVRDAAVRIEAFHNARAAHVLRARLEEDPNGGYVAKLPLRRPGLWEFRLEAQRGESRFTHRSLEELAWR